MNVMGRQSGFIAMQASMASGIVDCCLIPEISFNMDKVNQHISNVIERNGHCVICVAEGAGQVITFDSQCNIRSCAIVAVQTHFTVPHCS